MLPTFVYSANVQSVIDGDTLHVSLKFTAPPPFRTDLVIYRKLRLAGLNCPELMTEAGRAAKAFAAQWVIAHPGPYQVEIRGSGQDKYSDRIDGRLLAADGSCLNDALLAAGQAVPMKD